MTYKKMQKLPTQKALPTHTRPHVYLELEIGGDSAGRVVIELRPDVVPRTAENFRALCTGEHRCPQSGLPLHYRGTKFHKAMALFMVQGGDTSLGGRSGGESIYGHRFEDENFILEHEKGVVSMANEGRPDSNGSQFFITTVPCSHLDGTNVVFGRVVSGLGIFQEIEKYGTGPDHVPRLDCVIADCGELLAPDVWAVGCSDGTGDTLPEYPEDLFSQRDTYDIPPMTAEQVVAAVAGVKDSGNHYFKLARFTMALRKYQKCLRYLQYVLEKIAAEQQLPLSDTVKKTAESLQSLSHLNVAACELKLGRHRDAVASCNQVTEPYTSKALYRRAMAQHALHNYEAALSDLKQAERRAPGNTAVAALLTQVRAAAADYNAQQKRRLSKFFRA